MTNEEITDAVEHCRGSSPKKEDLKPCPICGSIDVHSTTYPDWIFCGKCRTEAPTVVWQGARIEES